jgi:hypothetical protein
MFAAKPVSSSVDCHAPVSTAAIVESRCESFKTIAVVTTTTSMLRFVTAEPDPATRMTFIRRKQFAPLDY